MRLGIIFPQAGLQADPSAVRDFAQAVESIGFTHLLVYDHVVGGDPDHHPEWLRYTHASLFHEPLTLFAFLAGLTTRLEFATGVLVLPQRQTALVAKQAAYVDRLSNGRLRLGIGVGWNALEYEALAEDFHTRGARIEEQVRLLRLLWADDVVTTSGRWHHVTAAGINPRPLRGRIPIWIGGAAEPVLKRVGRLADGWLPERAHVQPGFVECQQEPWGAMLDRVRAYAAACGRDPMALGIEPRLEGADPLGLAARLDEWSALGATHAAINVQPLGAPPISTNMYIDRARRIWDTASQFGSTDV